VNELEAQNFNFVVDLGPGGTFDVREALLRDYSDSITFGTGGWVSGDVGFVDHDDYAQLQTAFYLILPYFPMNKMAAVLSATSFRTNGFSTNLAKMSALCTGFSFLPLVGSTFFLMVWVQGHVSEANEMGNERPLIWFNRVGLPACLIYLVCFGASMVFFFITATELVELRFPFWGARAIWAGPLGMGCAVTGSLLQGAITGALCLVCLHYYRNPPIASLGEAVEEALQAKVNQVAPEVSSREPPQLVGSDTGEQEHHPEAK